MTTRSLYVKYYIHVEYLHSKYAIVFISEHVRYYVYQLLLVTHSYT